jgi:hypothetical protein
MHPQSKGEEDRDQQKQSPEPGIAYQETRVHFDVWLGIFNASQHLAGVLVPAWEKHPHRPASQRAGPWASI